MFWWLIVRIIGFSGWIVVLCVIMAVLTVSHYSLEQIDASYETEISAVRLTSIGLDPERRLPVERRGVYVSNFLGNLVDSIGRQRPRSRVSDGVQVTWYVYANDWWDDTKPKLKRFLPLAYIRIETYITIYLTCIGLYVFAFYLGEHYARMKIRSGVHKRNALPIWIRYALWLIRDFTVACIGLVVCYPVVYWVIPSLMLSCFIVTLWRANSIQGLAFLTPGKA